MSPRRTPFPYSSPFQADEPTRTEQLVMQKLRQMDAARHQALDQAARLQQERDRLEQQRANLAGELQRVSAERNELAQQNARLAEKAAVLGAEGEELKARLAAQPPPAAPVTDAERAEKEELQQRYMRLVADVENMRRRQATQLAQEVVRAKSAAFADLLPALDGLARARTASVQSVEPLIEGIRGIEGQILSALQKQGLERIDPQGGAFDPEVHEAIASVPSTQVPEGHIVESVRPGYRIDGRLIRPAQVVVAAPPGEGGSQ